MHPSKHTLVLLCGVLNAADGSRRLPRVLRATGFFLYPLVEYLCGQQTTTLQAVAWLMCGVGASTA